MQQICAGPGEPRLVSVIIPSYNRGYIIAETIESVLAQTYGKIEIIVVDDGSTDDTRSVVESYGDKVHYIYQTNAGCPAARNVGLAAARGEFIALLDSDDRWYPWKLELQIAFLDRHPQVGMVWTDMTAVTDDGTRIADRYLRTFYSAYRHVRIEDMMTRAGAVGELGVVIPAEAAAHPAWIGDVFSQLIRGTLIHTPTTVMRRERVRGTGGYDESLKPAGEDFDFHLRTAVQGPVGLLDVSTIDYRIGNDDQITAPSGALAMARNYIKTVQHWLNREGHRITLSGSEIRETLAYAHEWAGGQELMAGNRGPARHHLWQSVRREPGRMKALGLLLLALSPPHLFELVRATRRRLRGRSEGTRVRMAAGGASAGHFSADCVLTNAELAAETA